MITQNTITYKEFLKIKDQIFHSKELLFSAREPLQDILIKHFVCTNSSTVHVNKTLQRHGRHLTKYLDLQGAIRESHIIYLNGRKTFINIPCYYLDSNVKFVSDGNELQIHENKRESLACCLNKTHSLRLYGMCNDSVFNLSSMLHTYQFGGCNSFNQQSKVSYSILGNCLHTITYQILCNDDLVKNACTFDVCS